MKVRIVIKQKVIFLFKSFLIKNILFLCLCFALSSLFCFWILPVFILKNVNIITSYSFAVAIFAIFMMFVIFVLQMKADKVKDKVLYETKSIAVEVKNLVKEDEEILNETKKLVEEDKTLSNETKKLIEDDKALSNETKKLVEEDKEISIEIKKLVEEATQILNNNFEMIKNLNNFLSKEWVKQQVNNANDKITEDEKEYSKNILLSLTPFKIQNKKEINNK